MSWENEELSVHPPRQSSQFGHFFSFATLQVLGDVFFFFFLNKLRTAEENHFERVCRLYGR
jgi:hypothetical protein